MRPSFVPAKTPEELRKEHNDIQDQVFSIVVDGHVAYSEVMGMTNVQRAAWIGRMNKYDKQKSEAMEKARRRK